VGSNVGLCGETPETNRLSQGTVYLFPGPVFCETESILSVHVLRGNATGETANVGCWWNCRTKCVCSVVTLSELGAHMSFVLL
jgi:hypothetical protein